MHLKAEGQKLFKDCSRAPLALRDHFVSVVPISIFRGKKIYEPPRFMTVSQAADQLIQIIQRRREEGEELGELNLICFID